MLVKEPIWGWKMELGKSVVGVESWRMVRCGSGVLEAVRCPSRKCMHPGLFSLTRLSISLLGRFDEISRVVHN